MTYNHQLLKEELTRDEGKRLEPYKDSEGHLTIGVGHLMDSPLSERAVDVILDDDIAEAEADLDRIFPTWRDDLTDNRQRALLNMTFNLGGTRLRGFRKMWVAINMEDWKDAAAEALDSKWALQVGPRSQRIASMLEDG